MPSRRMLIGAFVIFVMVVVPTAVGAASALRVNPDTGRADTPTSFAVIGTGFPAGDYRVHLVEPGGMVVLDFALIVGANGDFATNINSDGTEPPGRYTVRVAAASAPGAPLASATFLTTGPGGPSTAPAASSDPAALPQTGGGGMAPAAHDRGALLAALALALLARLAIRHPQQPPPPRG